MKLTILLSLLPILACAAPTEPQAAQIGPALTFPYVPSPIDGSIEYSHTQVHSYGKRLYKETYFVDMNNKEYMWVMIEDDQNGTAAQTTRWEHRLMLVTGGPSLSSAAPASSTPVSRSVSPSVSPSGSGSGSGIKVSPTSSLKASVSSSRPISSSASPSSSSSPIRFTATVTSVSPITTTSVPKVASSSASVSKAASSSVAAPRPSSVSSKPPTSSSSSSPSASASKAAASSSVVSKAASVSASSSKAAASSSASKAASSASSSKAVASSSSSNAVVSSSSSKAVASSSSSNAVVSSSSSKAVVSSSASKAVASSSALKAEAAVVSVSSATPKSSAISSSISKAPVVSSTSKAAALSTTSTSSSIVPVSSASASASTAGGVSAADQAQYLTLHNQFRAKYSAGAVVWDNTLASFALKTAQTCKYGHTGGPYGENIAAGVGGGYNIDKAFSSWANEDAKYDFNKPGYSNTTGHFTQIVWKGTSKIGCASASCADGTIFTGYRANSTYVVCEYQAPGNVVSSDPARTAQIFTANVGPKVA